MNEYVLRVGYILYVVCIFMLRLYVLWVCTVGFVCVLRVWLYAHMYVCLWGEGVETDLQSSLKAQQADGPEGQDMICSGQVVLETLKADAAKSRAPEDQPHLPQWGHSSQAHGLLKSGQLFGDQHVNNPNLSLAKGDGRPGKKT